jgi:UDP-glucose 4-epimerase
LKVGVTGGAGYIGSTLVKELLSRKHEVVSVDNETIGSYEYLIENEIATEDHLIKEDIRNADLLEKHWKDCDAIAHLAALPGLVLCNNKPEEAVSVNVYGTYNVLKAAENLGIRKVVFCSSAAVYGKPNKLPVTEEHELNPLNLYGATKVSGEKILNMFNLNEGLSTVNLRFGNIYGVGLYTRWDTVIPKFVKQALKGEPLTIYGDGESSRDFVHVKDITNAIILSLCNPKIGGDTFNVGGETISINNLAKIVKEEVEKITGKKVESKKTKPRLGETKEFSYDLTHIKNRLGFKNQWTVEDGVIELVQNWLEINK